MNSKEKEKVEKMINELDGAVGRMIVTAMRDKTIREAMETVSKVSFELGNMLD